MPREILKSDYLYKWKQRGLICREGETYDDIFDRVQNTANCELCNVLLTSGRSKTGRCMDHDHSTGYFRQVLCRSCNVHHDKKYSGKPPKNNKTTGIKNISFHKRFNIYRYRKEVNKIKHQKDFKTLDQAIQYKLDFEKKIKDNV